MSSWFNLDVGYDYRPPRRGLGFAASIGFTRALTNRCPGGLLDACRGAPQAHIGFSYWF